MLGIFFGALFLAICVFVVARITHEIAENLQSLKRLLGQMWANIEVLLSARDRVIEELSQVFQFKGEHEKALLNKLSEAQALYKSARSTEGRIEAANKLGHALHAILALGDAYPEIRENSEYVRLRNQVLQFDMEIKGKRELFNRTVEIYRRRTEKMPDLLLVFLLRFPHYKIFSGEVNSEYLSLQNARKAA